MNICRIYWLSGSDSEILHILVSDLVRKEDPEHETMEARSTSPRSRDRMRLTLCLHNTTREHGISTNQTPWSMLSHKGGQTMIPPDSISLWLALHFHVHLSSSSSLPLPNGVFLLRPFCFLPRADSEDCLPVHLLTVFTLPRCWSVASLLIAPHLFTPSSPVPPVHPG